MVLLTVRGGNSFTMSVIKTPLVQPLNCVRDGELVGKLAFTVSSDVRGKRVSGA